MYKFVFLGLMGSIAVGLPRVVHGTDVAKHPPHRDCYLVINNLADERSLFGGLWSRVVGSPLPFVADENHVAVPHLRKIAEAPGDDTARLVYADRLDEAGEADAAAFVRKEIEIAQLEREWALAYGDEARLEKLEKQVHEARGVASELFERNKTQWMPQHLLGARTYTWERGFINKVEFHVADFPKNGPAVLGAIPTARTVEFYLDGSQRRLRAALGVSEMKNIDRLEISALRDGRIEFDAVARIVAAAPAAQTFKELKIRAYGGHLATLLQEGQFPQVEKLEIEIDSLHGNRMRFNAQDIRHSLRHAFPKLKELKMVSLGTGGGEGEQITSEVLQAFMDSELKFEKLDFRYMLAHDIDLGIVARSKNATALRELHTEVLYNPNVLNAFADSPHVQAPFILYSPYGEHLAEDADGSIYRHAWDRFTKKFGKGSVRKPLHLEWR